MITGTLDTEGHAKIDNKFRARLLSHNGNILAKRSFTDYKKAREYGRRLAIRWNERLGCGA